MSHPSFLYISFPNLPLDNLQLDIVELLLSGYLHYLSTPVNLPVEHFLVSLVDRILLLENSALHLAIALLLVYSVLEINFLNLLHF